MKLQFLFWSFAALLTVLAGLTSASAETPEWGALREVLAAKTPNDTANDPQWRASLAAALHRYCESVLVQVPRNTAAEDQWVDSENEAILSDKSADRRDWERYRQQMQRKQQRWDRVNNSIESARKDMRRILSECSSITKRIAERKEVSPAAEALLWARLSRLFSVEEIIWRMSEIIGLISPKMCSKAIPPLYLLEFEPPPPASAHDENNICFWGWIQYSILDHAVIPLLEMQ